MLGDMWYFPKIGEPKYRPQHTIVLIIGTPQHGIPNFWKSHEGSVEGSVFLGYQVRRTPIYILQRASRDEFFYLAGLGLGPNMDPKASSFYPQNCTLNFRKHPLLQSMTPKSSFLKSLTPKLGMPLRCFWENSFHRGPF